MRSGRLIPARGQVFITGGSCHRYHFYRDKSKFRHLCYKRVFVATKHVFLSRQKYACDKTFVATKRFCCDKHNFVATKLLSRQAYFCRDERRVLSRHTCLWRQKYASRIFLSRQNTSFVSTNTRLSRQTRVCRGKTFVVTKMILRQLSPMISISLWTDAVLFQLHEFQFSDAFRPQRPYGVLGTGSPVRPPRLSRSSWTLSFAPA